MGDSATTLFLPTNPLVWHFINCPQRNREGILRYCMILLQPRYRTLYNQNTILFAYTVYFKGRLIQTLAQECTRLKVVGTSSLHGSFLNVLNILDILDILPLFVKHIVNVSATSRSSWDNWLRKPLFFRYASTKKKMTGVLEWRCSLFEQRDRNACNKAENFDKKHKINADNYYS
jgi:hypothetical protein